MIREGGERTLNIFNKAKNWLEILMYYIEIHCVWMKIIVNDVCLLTEIFVNEVQVVSYIEMPGVTRWKTSLLFSFITI